MKISPSSSFDLNSNDAAGCLSGFLRRLLCWSIRNPTSKDGEEYGTDLCQARKTEQKKPPPSPGLVARLMGLESMPVFPYSPPDTIARSRSTNSIESWNGFLSGQRSYSPKIRTSQSFRESPTFLRKENEDFLLLSFSPDDKGEALASNGVKTRMGFGEFKEGKTEGSRNARKGRRTERRNEGRDVGKENALGSRRNEIEDKVSFQKMNFNRKNLQGMNVESSPKAMKQTEMPERSISTKKRSAYSLRKLEVECSSQNSSPVSVLDHALDIDIECHTGPDSPILEEAKEPKQQIPRRKLSSDIEGPSFPSPRIQLIKNAREGGLRSAGGDRNRRRSSERKEQGLSDILEQICRLAEEEVKKSNLVSREIWKSEVNGEIAVVLGMEILDVLLHEAVAELSSFNITV